jgi:ring-1,2-phenylacetyl-CoA epoxidase subunit PaaE
MKVFHLQIKKVIKETDDAATIVFWHPLNEVIKYKAGQFITLCATINGDKLRRAYSMSSSPVVDAALSVTIKRLGGGIVSNWLIDNAQAGQFIEVIEPMGRFFVEPQSQSARSHVFFGAGSGITPLYSMIKTLIRSEPLSKIYLVYGNRTEESILFKKELNQLEAENRGRLQIVYILSKPSATWVGGTDRINQAQAVYYMKQMGVDIGQAHYYLCGPQGMMVEVQKALVMFNVAESKVHKESFLNEAARLPEPEVFDTATKYSVRVNYDGNTFDFDVEPHQTILEAALERDIDLPYSCQAGMCTACLGICKSGSVKLDEEDGLTDKELAAGYVLTCVARPKSSGVVIDID